MTNDGLELSGRWKTAARSVAHPVRAAGRNGATSTRSACHQRHAPQHLTFGRPKNDRGRVVKLAAAAVRALRRHRKRQLEERVKAGSLWQDMDLVFTTTVGTPMDASNLTRQHLYPLLERAGLPRVRFHDLRHTFATLMLQNGEHPKVVQEMLGHANISETMDTYSHVLPDMQTDAMKRLGALF